MELLQGFVSIMNPVTLALIIGGVFWRTGYRCAAWIICVYRIGDHASIYIRNGAGKWYFFPDGSLCWWMFRWSDLRNLTWNPGNPVFHCNLL